MSAVVLAHPAVTKRFQMITDAAGMPYVFDTCDVMPSPPGLFVIAEGDRLSICRLEHVPFSNPPEVMMGDRPNRKRIATRDLTIRGRLIAKYVPTP